MHRAGEGMGAEKELLKMDLCMRETVQCFRGSKGKIPRFPIPFPEATVVHGFLCVLQVLSTLTWSFLCLSTYLFTCLGFPDVSVGKKNPPAMQETRVRFLGQEDTLEEGLATHSSILAWRIPWTEEPGGLQSMGSQRVGHDWVTERAFTCPAPFFPCIYIANYLSIHPYKKSGIFKWMFITNRAV